MGAATSSEATGDCESVKTPPQPQRQLNFDPRSPSVGIERTPILVCAPQLELIHLTLFISYGLNLRIRYFTTNTFCFGLTNSALNCLIILLCNSLKRILYIILVYIYIFVLTMLYNVQGVLRYFVHISLMFCGSNDRAMFPLHRPVMIVP